MINFGHNSPWGAISQTAFRDLARDTGQTLHYRVWMAALGWANQVGHTDFKGERLAEILVGKGGVIPSKQSITNAIARAKKSGLIHDSSNALCLVLPSSMFQKQGVGTRHCDVHGISKHTPDHERYAA